jgi:tetratricopeptide (TPR) repeat protein
LTRLRTILCPRTRLVLVTAIVLAGIFVRQRISRLDGSIFFYTSLPSAKGLVLYLIGDYSGSVKAYREHYRQIYEAYAPADSEAYALLRGDLKKGKTLAETALHKNPGAIQPLLTLGEISLEENSFEAALQYFNRVLEKETDQYDALLLSSIVHARLKEYGTAIHLINRALRHNKIHSRATTFLKLLETTGDLERSDSRQQPLCLLAHYHRYLGIFDADRADTAISYATKAIEAGDHADDAYLTLGIVYTKQWRTEKVLHALLHALQINPKNSEANRWASRIYGKRGDLVHEYLFMKAAYESAPDDQFYFIAFTDVMTERLGDFKQALSFTLPWVSKHPDDIPALSRAGMIYYYLRDYQRAVENYEAAVLLDPQFFDGFLGVGISHRESGNLEKAAVTFQKAIRLRPGNGNAHILLANIYYFQNRYREAIAQYEEGFKLGANDPGQDAILCWLYFETSEFKRAVRCYERILENDPNNVYVKHQLSFALKNLKP